MLSYKPEEMLRLTFPLIGDGFMPTDYGEALYAALSRINRQFHQFDDLRLSPIRVPMAAGDQLMLKGLSNSFLIQCRAERIRLLLELAGKSIVLLGKTLRIGIPQIEALQPAGTLIARYVSVKGKDTEAKLTEYLVSEIQRRFGAKCEEDYELHILRRRVVTIHNKRIFGFGVALTDIKSEYLSLQIQAHPPGGRGRYGGSFFTRGQLTNRGEINSSEPEGAMLR